jgi:hypothetical protein
VVTVFRREREAVMDATVTAKRSVNASLLVASVAVVIALAAVVVAVCRG